MKWLQATIFGDTVDVDSATYVPPPDQAGDRPTTKPTHLIVDGKAKFSLCGIRVKDPTIVPYVGIRFAAEHMKSGMVLCPECDARWER